MLRLLQPAPALQAITITSVCWWLRLWLKVMPVRRWTLSQLCENMCASTFSPLTLLKLLRTWLGEAQRLLLQASVLVWFL
jgi:hypothetical protein